MKKNILKISLIGFGIVLIALLTAAILAYFGVIQLNHPSEEAYPVRGVDVSSYQGTIDWAVLSEQGISFAFIKATEGSGFTDPNYSVNLQGAVDSGLRVGSYHFFSFDSSGETQARRFISAVPKTDHMLPPVIDIEFYGGNEANPPDAATVREELETMIGMLKEYYGLNPILYATEKSYEHYLANNFIGNDIWIRNVFTSPSLSDHRVWTFWQYSDKAVLNGYHGTEKAIDMNVFCGSKEEFDAFFP